MVIILLIGLLGISPVFGFINSGARGVHNDADGCLRGGVYYAEGATVPSEELCENCECNAGEVTCTVQSCRAPRYNCRPVGFIKGTCCPLKFECDDEINQLVPEIPFTNSDVKKFRNSPSAQSCISNGQRFLSGQSVPVFTPCQTSCACVDGSIACTQSACPSPPPAFLRCSKRKDLNECCPEYDCSFTHDNFRTSTCKHEGVSYEDGEFVPMSDKCSDCYCLDGEVVCAHQACPDPPADNCTPVTSSQHICCPQKYECFDVPPQEIDTVETPLTTEGTIEDKESTTTIAELASTNADSTDVVTQAPLGDSEVTEFDYVMTTAASTDAPVDVKDVTENNKEADKEKVTTVVEEGTEEIASTGDEFTTPEPIISESGVSETDNSTQEEKENFTTASIEKEFTTIATVVEDTEEPGYISSVTTINSNTDGNDNLEVGLTTIEPPIEAEPSTSISIEETTIDSSTDCGNTCGKELVTDETTIEPTTDYSTVTEDAMVTEITTLAFVDMCSNNGNVYSDGETIPPISQCQESCECRNGTVTCIEKACSSAPPAFLRCASLEVSDESDECCPKYDCPAPTPGPASPECVKDGIQYYEGEFVPSVDLCTDCYCMYGEVLCAFLECSPPVRDSCTPIYDDERACCPEYYECDIEGDLQTTTMYQTEEPETTTMYQTEEPETTTMYQTEEPEASADLSLLRFWL